MKDYTTSPNKLIIPKNDGEAEHLNNFKISNISLPNQDGNFLKLDRLDTFRIVLYIFPMTGRPDRSLPNNWNNIPGAKGCTIQNCTFRDHYYELIGLNALPIGISTQSIDDLKEMTTRLSIPYDILSDAELNLKNQLKLPFFSINNKIFLKRLTLVVEKTFVKKVFYPVYPVDKHIKKVLKWLKEN